jgi:hypothetical protein
LAKGTTLGYLDAHIEPRYKIWCLTEKSMHCPVSLATAGKRLKVSLHTHQERFPENSNIASSLKLSVRIKQKKSKCNHNQSKQ